MFSRTSGQQLIGDSLNNCSPSSRRKQDTPSAAHITTQGRQIRSAAVLTSAGRPSPPSVASGSQTDAWSRTLVQQDSREQKMHLKSELNKSVSLEIDLSGLVPSSTWHDVEQSIDVINGSPRSPRVGGGSPSQVKNNGGPMSPSVQLSRSHGPTAGTFSILKSLQQQNQKQQQALAKASTNSVPNDPVDFNAQRPALIAPRNVLMTSRSSGGGSGRAVNNQSGRPLYPMEIISADSRSSLPISGSFVWPNGEQQRRQMRIPGRTKEAADGAAQRYNTVNGFSPSSSSNFYSTVDNNGEAVNSDPTVLSKRKESDHYCGYLTAEDRLVKSVEDFGSPYTLSNGIYPAAALNRPSSGLTRIRTIDPTLNPLGLNDSILTAAGRLVRRDTTIRNMNQQSPQAAHEMRNPRATIGCGNRTPSEILHSLAGQLTNPRDNHTPNPMLGGQLQNEYQNRRQTIKPDHSRTEQTINGSFNGSGKFCGVAQESDGGHLGRRGRLASENSTQRQQSTRTGHRASHSVSANPAVRQAAHARSPRRQGLGDYIQGVNDGTTLDAEEQITRPIDGTFNSHVLNGKKYSRPVQHMLIQTNGANSHQSNGTSVYQSNGTNQSEYRPPALHSYLQRKPVDSVSHILNRSESGEQRSFPDNTQSLLLPPDIQTASLLPPSTQLDIFRRSPETAEAELPVSQRATASHSRGAAQNDNFPFSPCYRSNSVDVGWGHLEHPQSVGGGLTPAKRNVHFDQKPSVISDFKT